MKTNLLFDLIILLFAGFIFYSISNTSLEISEKSPPNQRSQSFVFPLEFSEKLQTPLYSKLIYLILDGTTYDFFDKRVVKIPNSSPECYLHTHQVSILNELLDQSPDSVVLQRMQIESPPKTEIKISTFLKGTNPAFFSMKIPQSNPYQLDMQDSLFYQIKQSPKLVKNYGYLTYHLYNFVGYHLTQNQFALNPYYKSYQQLKDSDNQKNKEYMKIIESNEYDTLFIYEGIIDEAGHLEGMHTQDVLDAHKYLDSVFRRIVEAMDEDAILLATSDHGKNENGDHFDCHDNNKIVCNSLFFAYTKKGFIQGDKFISELRRKENDVRISSQAGKYSAHESQISSTISNLMNIPISYINSGRTLFELYPKSKFNNRIEMLQRVLQDSFTTLEQQLQFYQYIQRKTNIFNKEEYNQIINDIESIQNSLFYEDRDVLISTESNLESTIRQIVAIQNKIQLSIYSNNFYSISLLIFGIILSGAIILGLIVKTFFSYVIQQKQFRLYAFLFLSSAISSFIYFFNNIYIMRYYGIIILILFVLFKGKEAIKNIRKSIFIFTFFSLFLAISLSKQLSTNSMYPLKIISTLCDIQIFIFDSEKIIQERKLQTQFHGSFMVVTILVAAADGVFHQISMNFIQLFINIVFYILSLYNQNRLNLQFFREKNCKIDLVVINILWIFLGAFSNKSNFQNCAIYYPIAIVSIYLLCQIIYQFQLIFHSFYTYVHVGILSGVLFQLLNLQEDYVKYDFSILLIIFYYFPLLLIPLMFRTEDQIQQLQITPLKLQISELDAEHSIVAKDSANTNSNNNNNNNHIISSIGIQQEQQEQAQEEQIEEYTPGNESYMKENLKDGLLLLSSILILCSCLGQVMIINDQKIFPEKDKFIFSSEYLMTYVIILLFINLFIR